METRAVVTPQASEAVHAWHPERAATHEGSLDGATLTGEVARGQVAIRIGLWLDEKGTVRQTRWRCKDDPDLGAYAETACRLVEAGTSPLSLEGEALKGAVARAPLGDDRPALVVAALRSALLLWARRDA